MDRKDDDVSQKSGRYSYQPKGCSKSSISLSSKSAMIRAMKAQFEFTTPFYTSSKLQLRSLDRMNRLHFDDTSSSKNNMQVNIEIINALSRMLPRLLKLKNSLKMWKPSLIEHIDFCLRRHNPWFA